MTRILVSLLMTICILLPVEVAAQPDDGTILSREPVVLPNDAPDAARTALDGVALERLIYASDGLEVEGFLAQPSDGGGEKLPCVIYNRGGNRDFGAITPLRAAFLLARIAKHGYVVAASNYRGNGAFGAAKYPGERKSPEGDRIGGVGREEFGGAEVHDILALIPLLAHVDRADTSRMGIFGWSRGGMMTYLTLKSTNRFKAAVVGGGLVDLAAGIDERPEMEKYVYSELIPGWNDPAKRAAAIEARSAIRWVDKLPATTPILLLQGTADWRVSPMQTLAMAESLQAERHPYRLVMFEGGDHGLSEYREEVARLASDWLDRYVRDGKTWPSLEPHGR
jgi:dipeptidyl aminopeptidase/acylaminoacyl peptidase